MADRLGLKNEVRELKIGQSFMNPKATGFHTIKYDFKPASVDTSKKATVDVGNNHQVSVTVPHLDGAGVPHTVFKGSQRPYQKECVLIIDRLTGEITLEKLSSNIQVKKTRTESAKPPLPQERQANNENRSGSSSSNMTSRSLTPPMGRISNRTKVTSGSRRPDRQITNLVPKHSPLHASPNYPSPGHLKSPRNNHLNDYQPSSTPGSLPMIDAYDPPPVLPIPPAPPSAPHSTHNHQPPPEVGEISNSSSSSSSDSDSDSDNNTTVVDQRGRNGYSNGNSATGSGRLPTELLTEDLCLSEDSE